MSGYDSLDIEDGIAAEFVRLPEAAKLSGLVRGTILFSPGDPCDRLFVLETGSVKLAVNGATGRECVFHVVQPGELFGENALLGAESHRYGAQILETASAFSVPATVAARRMSKEPDLWLRAAPLLCARLQRLEERLLWVTFLDVKQRLARLILSLLQSDSGPPELSISQKELAGMVGATRETASSALSCLQRDGCIRTQRRRIAVISTEKLVLQAGELPSMTRGAESRAASA